MKKMILGLCAVMVLGLSGCSGTDTKNTAAVSLPTATPTPASTQIQSSTPEITSTPEVQTESVPTVAPEQTVVQGVPSEPSSDSHAEALRLYREERESIIKEQNGIVEGGSNENDYGLDLSGTKYFGVFDTRESVEAGKTAREYITNTLGVEQETKLLYYMCIDPEILRIYEDGDKGVCAGYTNENIYVLEFCENGVWKYVFMVRDGKGSSWRVIHCGNSYKE